MTKKILIHFVLVLLFLMIPVLSSPDFDGSFGMLSVPQFRRELLKTVLLIVFFYMNFLVLMPKFYNSRRYFTFAVVALLCYLLIITVPYLIIEPNPHPRPEAGPDMRPGMRPIHHEIKQNYKFIFRFAKTLLPFGFSLLCSSYLYINIKKKEAEMQKNKAELLSLKYQLQPHFLFNILNNIYSLSLLKSDAAPESILKLSNVMRYVVNEYNKDEVLLKDETAYLEDYIALQLMRTDENLEFNFNKNIGNENLKIAPMILVSFIENAFKYGYNAEENSKISIDISTSGNTLLFRIKNKIVNHSDMEDSSKIGMKNTMEQLNYLYPNRYILDIKEDSEEYSVDLKIDLIP
ncbi:MAG: histidine kinase [Bergeyella sp.]